MLSFFKDFIYLFLEEGKDEEREALMMCERNTDQLSFAHPQLGTWPTTQACALTRNQTSDLLVHRPALNPLSHTSQGNLWHFNYGVPWCGPLWIHLVWDSLCFLDLHVYFFHQIREVFIIFSNRFPISCSFSSSGTSMM